MTSGFKTLALAGTLIAAPFLATACYAGTIVGLVDQVHTLRGQLDLLARAIAAQPPATREAIAGTLRRLSRS